MYGKKLALVRFGGLVLRLIALCSLCAPLLVFAPVGVRTHFGNNCGRYGGRSFECQDQCDQPSHESCAHGTERCAGEYAVDALMPGKYKVEVQAANFKTATQDVTLEVGQVLPLNFTLSAGAVTETVEVTSEAPMV